MITYLGDKAFVEASVMDKIAYLKRRAEEVMLEDLEDGEALDKIFRLINLLPDLERT